MKHRYLHLLVTATILLMLLAPHVRALSAREGSGPTLKVLAVETFLADLARNVAGNRVEVNAMLPVGADPHSFDPTPADVTQVAKSNVLIVNGYGFEEFWDKLLQNAGGVHEVIDASTGLSSRSMREGETAEMDDSDLADAICDAVSDERIENIQAGGDPGSAAKLPTESGSFEIVLTKQEDGSYNGFLEYAVDEKGDFQIATGNGRLQVLAAANLAPLVMERTVPLGCKRLKLGSIAEFEKDGKYIIALTGFKTEKCAMLIGPLTGHHHQEGDPHFWLDPDKVVTYVRNIQRGLSEADPDGASIYAANADGYIARLRELDRWIADQVAQVPPGHRLMVTNHESFGYFADRYGFKIIGTIVPSVSTDAAPSARQLARLIDRIKATGARAIFLETGTNPQLARQVAQETGIKVVADLYTHSITEAGGPAPDYIAMMQHNTVAIVDALKQ
jgi:manganese/iron transport system substrate-binding protein